MDKKTCFVIQGFGKKNDFQQAKVFDLDASYEVIKEAVEDAGLTCFRADELSPQGIIDQKMYDALLDADVVIADLSTLNANALFELGVRFALRPYATIVVAEQGINFPFDVNHIYINTYHHLGEDVGRRDAREFQKRLKPLVQKAAAEPELDSPVYRFLDRIPRKGFIELAKIQRLQAKSSALEVAHGGSEDSTYRELMVAGREAMATSEFERAIPLWKRARELGPKDDFLVQQLALATYKSKKPTEEAALVEAQGILTYLKPRESFDTETLGLWAAVHKRLFKINGEERDLEEAIFALERGFYIQNDYYNGINLAFMLDQKAVRKRDQERNELHVVARHVRRRVKNICLQKLTEIAKELSDPDLSAESRTLLQDSRFWVLATLFEVSVGLRDATEAATWKDQKDAAAAANWMKSVSEEQANELRELLAIPPV
jgi:hypothetical protein